MLACSTETFSSGDTERITTQEELAKTESVPKKGRLFKDFKHSICRRQMKPQSWNSAFQDHQSSSPNWMQPATSIFALVHFSVNIWHKPFETVIWLPFRSAACDVFLALQWIQKKFLRHVYTYKVLSQE